MTCARQLCPARLPVAPPARCATLDAHGGGSRRRSLRPGSPASAPPLLRPLSALLLLFVMGMAHHEVPAPDRPAGAHRRLHHRHPGCDRFDAAAWRRQRVEPDLAGDLRAGGVLITAPPATPGVRRITAGLHADPLGRWRWPVAIGVGIMSCSRSGCRCSAHLAVVLPQPGAAVLPRAPTSRSRTTVHPGLSDLSRGGENQRDPGGAATSSSASPS